MIRRSCPLLFWLVMAGSPGLAQEWAEKLFETTSYDFGTVAQGAKAEYRFVLKNRYLQEVHIARVSVTCGCTTPRIEKEWLKTYENGAIVAAINSQRFLGRQRSTITVTFDKPQYAQVQLDVKVYVRRDVILEPGSVMLGEIDRGRAVEKAISIRHLGSNAWRILEVKSGNPHLTGEVLETRPDRGRVSYRLNVRLKEDAPSGYIREHLVLVTNDQRSREIPILVEGHVLSDLVVSPSSLFLGVVRPGDKITRQVVVRSKEPFRITSISGDCECLRFDAPDTEAAKSLHLVPVTFIVANKSGRIAPKIRLRTDRDGQGADISAFGVVTSER